MAKTKSADRQRQWRELIERQQASGQSIVGFCAKERLSPASFHAWKRRLRGLRRLIEEDGLRGMTSNPAIFEKAIAESHEYGEDIRLPSMNRQPCGPW